MRIKVWPFLVGKNRHLGYRPVVIPTILYAANVPGQLDRFRSNQSSEEPKCEVVDIEKVGSVTAIYRVTHMTSKVNGEIYVDLQNRPIIWSEGLLIRGSYPDLQLPSDVFTLIHRQLEAYAEEFYSSEREGKPIISDGFEIELSGEDMRETIKSLRAILAKLKKQETELRNYIKDLDQKVKTGKTLTYVGIPLILVVVGLIVVPVGLHMSKMADKERQDPEADLRMIRQQIREVETAIQRLEEAYRI
jgi:hypothetical protein